MHVFVEPGSSTTGLYTTISAKTIYDIELILQLVYYIRRENKNSPNHCIAPLKKNCHKQIVSFNFVQVFITMHSTNFLDVIGLQFINICNWVSNLTIFTIVVDDSKCREISEKTQRENHHGLSIHTDACVEPHPHCFT